MREPPPLPVPGRPSGYETLRTEIGRLGGGGPPFGEYPARLDGRILSTYLWQRTSGLNEKETDR